MHPIKKFFQQFSWLAIAELWGKIVVFVLLTIVAHIGTGQLGVYAYILSIVGIFSIVSDFGTTGIYIREAKKNPADSVSLLAQFLFLKVLIVIFFVAASVGWLSFTHSSATEWGYFFLYGTFIIFDTFTLLFLAHVRTKELFGYEAFVKIVAKAALLISLGVSALLGSLDLFDVFLAYALSGAVGFCVAGVSVLPEIARKILRGTYRPNRAIMKMAFYQSFPLGLSTVFWQIYYRIDTVLLKGAKGDVITGYYTAAYSILQLINVLPTLAMAVLFPKLVDRFQANPKSYITQFRKIAGAFFLVGCVLCILTLLSAPIIPYYFGEEYRESVHLLRILACAVPVLYLNAVLAYGLVVIKKTSTLTLISFVGLVVNVSSNIVLIPRYGAVAAAWTTALTEYTVSACSLIALSRAHRKLL